MIDQTNYWKRFTVARLSRRRAILVAGSTASGLAGLALLGCGSGSSSSRAVDHSGLLSTPADSTSRIVKGGDYPQALARDTSNFDVSSNEGDLTAAEFAYSRLIKYKAFKYPE